MPQYVRTAKAEECVKDAREHLKALVEPTIRKVRRGLFNQEFDEPVASPFSPQTSETIPNFGPPQQTMSVEGSIMANLVSQIVKQEYDGCMGRNPTFLPKKPAAGIKR